MSQADIAVVILNWNGKTFLEKFLPFVIKNSKDHARIIVADNGSTDGSVEHLEGYLPDIDILRFDTNLGYTGGYNRALKMIDARYYVLLNSDIKVTDNWLMPVFELMRKNENIVACQPKIMQYNNPDVFDYAGAAGGFIDFLGYPFCRGRIFETLERDYGQYDKTDNEVFWASGACMFIKADYFHEAGGFDENFFAHMEEIDLCWRLKLSGKIIAYCPDSVVYHVGGGTLPKTNPQKTYLNFRNSLWVMAKNLPAKKFYKLLPVRLALDELAALKFLINGNYKNSIAVLRAHIGFIRKLRLMRKHTHKAKGVKVTKKYRRSIVWDYFVRKKDSYNKLPKDRFSN